MDQLYTRRAVLVEPRVAPMRAWAHISGSQDRLFDDEVLQAWSGFTIDDVLPTHVNRLVFAISEQEHDRLATAEDLWRIWRLAAR